MLCNRVAMRISSHRQGGAGFFEARENGLTGIRDCNKQARMLAIRKLKVLLEAATSDLTASVSDRHLGGRRRS
jgi:hypothetical protein